MNKLSRDKRRMILSMLVEGSSMRSTSRIVDCSINTVTKLLVDAGAVCRAYHEATVRNVPSKRVQCDEIWSFIHCKEKNVETAKAAPPAAGDVWTWTAIDENKLIVSFAVGARDAGAAYEFMQDLKGRLSTRVQLSTDGHRPYLEAVGDAFGDQIDYAMLVKIYGEAPEKERRRYSPARCMGIDKRVISGEPDPVHISTSHVERQNLSMRMGMRRFTRLTNAFSKKVENHLHMLSIYFVHYNFIRRHQTLKTTPAVKAGVAAKPRDLDWLVDLVDAAN